MGRRQQDTGEDISLFPFLSVLACVIGTLAMVIAIIVLQSLDNETVERAVEYEKKEAELEQSNEELGRLKDELKKKETELEAERSEEMRSLEEAKKRLAELLAQLEKTDEDLKKISIEGPKVDVAAQNEEIGIMQAELKSRREKIAQLTAQITDRKLPPKESETSILPSGSGVGATPYFVECDDGRIVIHDGAKTTPVRTAELNTNPDFAKLLEEVKNDANGTLIFLIRNDGLDSFNAARNFANTKGVTNGKLPVIGDGRIDLSYFKKQSKNS